MPLKGSWERLVASRRDNIRYQEWERDQKPEYCPHDGAVLEEREDGTRNCPMGNYRWEP